ncbi:MAG: hypothetical protein QM770_18100 [Tepidisphaeraceae bacterium]
MRTIVLILITLGLLVGGLFVFVTFFRQATPEQIAAMEAQRAKERDAGKNESTSRPTTDPSGNALVGAGEMVRVETRDPKNPDRVINDFAAARYVPRRDGPVDVEKPVARFFLNNGRIVVLEGASGQIFMSGGSRDPQMMAAQGPSRGELHDVTIRYYETREQLDQKAEPILAVSVDNVLFDNATYRVETKDGVVNGRRVAADQIPVTVRGRDYEFDGTGLVAQWNDVANRIEMLEIAHGKRLLVKNPGMFLKPETPEQASAEEASDVRLASLASPHDALMLALLGQVTADAPDNTALDASGLRQKTSRYIATFENDVVAKSGDVEVAHGTSLRASFSLEPESKSAPGGNKKKKRRAEPSTKPVPSELAQPLEVRWSGRLRVLPSATEKTPTTQPDEPPGRFVELIGKPAVVTRPSGTITAAVIHIEADAGKFSLTPSDSVPEVSLVRGDGSKVIARSIDADRDRGSAVIVGPGHLVSAQARSHRKSQST